eukprot:CAMPEP_0202688760 /NCGR_PEP_ID=MMETSP1385-20130828/4205_1 /ASSEMBLY_ACC=CAM_ASM_000861 /TAXON_ID=933848 /ORGANISM="Elphidium margaritaceum" /LENGTH=220 /DNA_ID=CAMNT_0049343801 /DNA_START=89 /DNA_END=751 /DNA_ORIENTATION=-
MSSKKVLLKLIILGESGVGKTALLHKYVMNRFIEEHKATIGADFSTKDITIGDKFITLQIWDTAGLERFQSLGHAFYRGADACVLVYDVTKQKSFDQINEWRRNFLDQSQTEYPDKFPFLLLGNKVDLADSARVVSTESGKQLAQSLNMLFFETSAVHGTNIEEAIRNISDKASEMESAPIFNTEVVDVEDAFDVDEDTAAEEETKDAAGCGGLAACQLL